MKLRFLQPLLLVIACTPALDGQGNYWTEIGHGLPGGLERVVQAESNGWLYASTTDRYYRSVDEGLSWQLIYDASAQPVEFSDFSVSDNGILYARSNYSGSYDIYRSTDGGSSWGLHEEDSPFYDRVETNDGYVLAKFYPPYGNTEPLGIYRTLIGENNWELILELESFSGGNLQFDQFGHLQIGNLVTQDNGTTWDSIAIDTNLYAGHDIVFISGNKYLVNLTVVDTSLMTPSYQKLAIGMLGDTTLQFITPDPDTPLEQTYYRSPFLLADGGIVISVNLKLFRSDDEGQTWTFMTDDYWPTWLHEFRPFVTVSGNKIIGAINKQIKASYDGGMTWVPSYQGINERIGLYFGINQNTGAIWTTNGDRLFKAAPSNATSWTQINVDLDSTHEYRGVRPFSIASNGDAYVVKDSLLLVSYDDGEHFTLVPSDDSLFNFPMTVDGSDFLFINARSGLLRLDRSTQEFEPMNISQTCRKVNLHPSGKLVALFYENNGEIELKGSDDAGFNWTHIASPLDSSVAGGLALKIKSFMMDSDGAIYLADDSNFYRSDDLGGSWVHLYSVEWPESIYSVDINESGDIFICIFSALNSRIIRSNNQGNNWTTLPWVEDPYDDSIVLPWVNGPNSMFIDNEGYLYVHVRYRRGSYGFQRTTHPTTTGAYLFGNSSKSEDNDCTTFDPELPMEDIIIKAKGNETWFTRTDTLAGDYEMFIDTGMYEVTAIPPLPFFWDSCTTTVNLPIIGDTAWADFSMPSLGDCPFITVDLATPFLERCFEQDIFIQYCNHGTLPADSVVLIIEIDSFLTLTDSILDWQPIPDTTGLSTLTLPALDVNECLTIATPVLVSCDADLGRLHCITVNGWPNEICLMPAGWSGAEIQATATCEDTTVVLQLENVGTGPSQPLEFVIVEDDVVLMTGEEDYAVAEVATYSMPSNGSYFRIESEQEPEHPFPGNVAAWNVGCNGDGSSSVQFIQQFPLGDELGSEDSNCANNAGSFDPNDKQGSPLGFGPDHLIEPGTDIEYLIRFQNTGTAPAHNVVIRDTLSLLLNPSTVRVGAASHPFTWDFTGGNELVFRFDDINLIDSMSNEPASHGFISFKISHQANLPLGSVIPNSAAIYFDFNLPIITNTTLHQLGVDFLEILSAEREVHTDHANRLMVYPNPALNHAFVELPPNSHQVELFDCQGQLIQSRGLRGDRATVFERGNLPNGIYLLRATDVRGTEVGNAKLIFD